MPERPAIVHAVLSSCTLVQDHPEPIEIAFKCLLLQKAFYRRVYDRTLR